MPDQRKIADLTVAEFVEVMKIIVPVCNCTPRAYQSGELWRCPVHGDMPKNTLTQYRQPL